MFPYVFKQRAQLCMNIDSLKQHSNMNIILIYLNIILDVFLQNIEYLFIALEYKVLDMVETLYLEMNGIVIVVTLLTSKICIILLSYVHILQI